MSNYKILLISLLLFTCHTLKAQEENTIINEQNVTTQADLTISSNTVEDSSISKAAKALQEAANDSKTKSKITLAQVYYQKSYNAFKDNNLKRAKKNFNLFLDTLKSADIDSALYFVIFDNLNEILKQLNTIYFSTATTITPITKDYSIAMSSEDNSLVEKYITIYSSKSAKERIQLAFERSGAYKDIILETLRGMNLPEELLYLPIVESLYNINTVSRAGAVGLWQIMAHRGRALGLQINYWVDERKDPEKSTKAACLYLKQLYLMLNDWHLALAAYNRGEYGLIRDMRFSNASSISEMINRNAIPKETQNYVPQFIAAATIAKDLKLYGFSDLKYDPPLKYDVYYTDKVIDLKIVASCANTTLEEVKKLNPALQAWSTPLGYSNFALKIPSGSKDLFLENLSKVKDLNPSPGFVKHKVVKGEYLEKIASKYKTSQKEIYKDNPFLLKHKYLKPGQTLIIRPGRKYFK
ncbi:MAG: transglycosylase SLT domain-containing protein [Endomicrobium sp.]|jgi:membrane-bound lytic murein transglycosylase D|nr:transglycosylase SLT domain-containing protein [Endomicrobium sp.]